VSEDGYLYILYIMKMYLYIFTTKFYYKYEFVQCECVKRYMCQLNALWTSLGRTVKVESPLTMSATPSHDYLLNLTNCLGYFKINSCLRFIL
jgi:hypothetical protein